MCDYLPCLHGRVNGEEPCVSVPLGLPHVALQFNTDFEYELVSTVVERRSVLLSGPFVLGT
jgi:hypothetical protein